MVGSVTREMKNRPFFRTAGAAGVVVAAAVVVVMLGGSGAGGELFRACPTAGVVDAVRVDEGSSCPFTVAAVFTMALLLVVGDCRNSVVGPGGVDSPAA